MIFQHDHSMTAEHYIFESAENFSFPMHIHSCYEIIYVLDGEMDIQINFVDYRVKKGEMIFVFPYQLHALYTKDKSKDRLCIFSGELVALFDRTASGRVPENPVIDVSDTYLAELFLCCREDADIIRIKGLLYLLCSELLIRTNLTKQGGSGINSVELMDKIVKFIEENYKETCNLDLLSKKIGYNPSYVSNFFSKFVGITFNDYVCRFRISEAAYMLKNTNKTIATICFECGFSSVRTFNRNFLKIMGLTPLEYRQKK